MEAQQTDPAPETSAEPLDIVWYPAAILRRKAEPITEIDEDLVALADAMIELMHRDRGVGLAGPQVGMSKRIFVMCPTAERGQERVVLNPVIERRGGRKRTDTEGCLSLPGITGKIERPYAVTMTYFDLEGEEQTIELEDFDARVAQHEYDHLEGILIVDRMGAAERAVADRALRDLIRRREQDLERRS